MVCLWANHRVCASNLWEYNQYQSVVDPYSPNKYPTEIPEVLKNHDPKLGRFTNIMCYHSVDINSEITAWWTYLLGQHDEPTCPTNYQLLIQTSFRTLRGFLFLIRTRLKATVRVLENYFHALAMPPEDCLKSY